MIERLETDTTLQPIYTKTNPLKFLFKMVMNGQIQLKSMGRFLPTLKKKIM